MATPKHMTNQLIINSYITTLRKTTILCLPAVLSLQTRASISPRETFTFPHSLCHCLREMEQHSHDGNATMATEVARRLSVS